MKKLMLISFLFIFFVVGCSKYRIIHSVFQDKEDYLRDEYCVNTVVYFQPNKDIRFKIHEFCTYATKGNLKKSKKFHKEIAEEAIKKFEVELERKKLK